MIKYCKKCLMPSSRPRINFNNQGVCNACNYKKKFIKTKLAFKEQELKKILKKNKLII